MQYTTKLKLKKPELTDYVNIADINNNMEILDTEIAKMTDAETGVEAKLNQHAADKNNPHGVTKKQVGLENVQDYGVATQAEAEVGTSTTKYMTPQRTKQAFDKNMTPLNNMVNEHLEDVMPHIFIGANGKINRWGLGEDANGIYFIREEMI
ncbi:hypothetical protein AB1K09_06495 [Solibacillus silvestris]